MSWESYIERLRENPEDGEALDALEAYLERRRPASAADKAAAVGSGARFGFRMFLGPPLYEAIVRAWDAWSAYLRSGSQGEWPEAPTRDMAAAFAARFVRIGMFGLFLGLLPAIILGFQTAMMGIQLFQIQEQNRIVQEQNELTRDQFGALYQPQFLGMLYDASDRSDPRLRAAALRALVEMEGSRVVKDDEEGPAPLELDLAGVQLAKVSIERLVMPGVVLSGASLNKSRLEDVDLSGAKLDGADLFSSKLVRVSLKGADLTKANFNGARLEGVDLTGATIEGASFSKATFESVTCPSGEPASADGC